MFNTHTLFLYWHFLRKFWMHEIRSDHYTAYEFHGLYFNQNIHNSHCFWIREIIPKNSKTFLILQFLYCYSTKLFQWNELHTVYHHWLLDDMIFNTRYMEKLVYFNVVHYSSFFFFPHNFAIFLNRLILFLCIYIEIK